MQKPWQNYDSYEFEPVDLRTISSATRDYLVSYSIEFIAIGLEHAGDFRLHAAQNMQWMRFFQSADGAVLGWVAEMENQRSYNFLSILVDGTLVHSTPSRPSAPWNCCRFPVHVNFGAGCGLEDLLVLHLNCVAELEAGCGAALKYDTSQVRDVVLYREMLVHETIHGQGAPSVPLPVPQVESIREMARHS